MDKLVTVILWGIFLLGTLVLGKAFKDGKTLPVRDTEQIKEEKRDEIQNTPAADLVNDAPNADELRADAAGIAGRAKQRLRDRIGKIVSRTGGPRNSLGGGK
jgi:hypothetical protein